MLNKNFLLCMIALLFIGVSCSRDGTTVPESSVTKPSFVAYYPPVEMDGVKSEAGEVQYRMYWNVGDVMAIVNVSQGGRVDTYTSIARVHDDDGAGKFVADASYSYNPDDLLFAVYPNEAIEGIDVAGSSCKITVSLADNQSYISKTDSPMFARNDIQVSPMFAASSLLTSGSKYPGIVMKRMTGMIRILSHVSDAQISSEAISTVSLCAKGIAGSADITFSGKSVGATPSMVQNGGTAQMLTVNLPNMPKVGSTAPIAEFIPVFPFWLGKDSTRDGFSIIYTTTNYNIGFHREVSSNLRSNNVLAMSLFEGAYTRVFSQEEAVGDTKWWYTTKGGGICRPGEFEADGEMGSSAGRFVE